MTTQDVPRSSRTAALVLSLALVSGALIVAAPPATASATLLVCPAGCPYATIAAALAAAAPGDEIVVRPGTYVGSLSISTSVTLCSTGAAGSACAPSPAATTIQGTTAYPILVYADDVTVRGFTIQNPAYTATDQTIGASAPALVGVLADRASILDNVLQHPAAAPGAGQTRKYTVGVSIGNADDTTVARNVMRDFVPARGPGGACPSGPCEVMGILKWGTGAGLVVEDNDIRLLNVGAPASGIEFAGNDGVVITGNFLRVPGTTSAAGGVNGIETTLEADNVLVEDNDIATALLETPFGIQGIDGAFTNSVFRGNEFRSSANGLVLRASSTGGNLVEENLFLNDANGVLNFDVGTLLRDNTFSTGRSGLVLDAGSAGVVLHDNVFRDLTTPLAVTPAVTGTSVDAKGNDWGVYSRALIEARNDEGDNAVDVSCFIDADGVTRVCPTAGFTHAILNDAWPRRVGLTDTSTSGNRAIVNWTWSLPSGSFAFTRTVQFDQMPGSSSVQLTVRDSEGFEDTVSQTIATPNTAPTLSAPATANAVEGTTFALSLAPGDAEGDALVVSMSGAPTGATLDAATGEFAWDVPYAAAPASYVVTFEVTDGAATTSATTSLVVTDTPVAPIVAPIDAHAVLEGGFLSVNVSAVDPEGGLVTLSATSLPTGATFVDRGDNTGEFTWAPGPATRGTYVIDVTATAANAMTHTQPLVVSVTALADLKLTRVTPQTVQGSPGQTIVLTTLLKNTGLGPDTFRFTATDNAGWAPTVRTRATLQADAQFSLHTTVVIPATGGTTTVFLKACSTANASRCAIMTWHVLTPLVVSLEMPDSFRQTDPIQGTAVVQYLDGSPVVGASIVVVQESARAPELLRSDTGSATDAQGRAPFSFEDFTARVQGNHRLYVTAFHHTSPTGFHEDQYFMGLM